MEKDIINIGGLVYQNFDGTIFKYKVISLVGEYKDKKYFIIENIETKFQITASDKEIKIMKDE